MRGSQGAWRPSGGRVVGGRPAQPAALRVSPSRARREDGLRGADTRAGLLRAADLCLRSGAGPGATWHAGAAGAGGDQGAAAGPHGAVRDGEARPGGLSPGSEAAGAGCEGASAEAGKGPCGPGPGGHTGHFSSQWPRGPYLKLMTVTHLALTPKGLGFCTVLQPQPQVKTPPRPPPALRLSFYSSFVLESIPGALSASPGGRQGRGCERVRGP